MKKKKKIRRKPGVKRNMYFGTSEQDAIVSFQSMEASRERDTIFQNKILPAFTTLSESLIHVYGFKSPMSSTSELTHNCVLFLHDAIHKWNPDKGTKAFSYFNVVAKNWLINSCKSQSKRAYAHISLSDISAFSPTQLASLKDKNTVPSAEEIIMHAEYREEIAANIKSIRNELHDEKDLITISALEHVFSCAEQLDFLNRRAILVYLREISGLDKRSLSKSLFKIKGIYREKVKKELLR